MRRKLSKKWIKHLLFMPESGMGYQTIDIILKNGQVIEQINVFNAEDMELPDKYKHLKVEKIKDIVLHKK